MPSLLPPTSSVAAPPPPPGGSESPASGPSAPGANTGTTGALACSSPSSGRGSTPPSRCWASSSPWTRPTSTTASTISSPPWQRWPSSPSSARPPTGRSCTRPRRWWTPSRTCGWSSTARSSGSSARRVAKRTTSRSGITRERRRTTRSRPRSAWSRMGGSARSPTACRGARTTMWAWRGRRGCWRRWTPQTKRPWRTKPMSGWPTTIRSTPFTSRTRRDGITRSRRSRRRITGTCPAIGSWWSIPTPNSISFRC